MNCDHLSQFTCVKNVPIFKGLTDEELMVVQKTVKNQTYQKGEYIFQEDEPSTTLYIVHRGMVKLVKLSEVGKEQIIRILFPGDFFGQYALLENKYHYANAEVLEETSICLIQKDDFRTVLERNPSMAMKYMMVLSERLQLADEWIGAISLMEVEKRLAKALLSFFEKEQKEEFELPVSKKDFASLIGTTPETLSRKLVSLQSQQVLKLSGRKRIQLLSVESLKELAKS
jgi:CRP-like cAMP-binding protein